jgi:hypothetical protein
MQSEPVKWPDFRISKTGDSTDSDDKDSQVALTDMSGMNARRPGPDGTVQGKFTGSNWNWCLNIFLMIPDFFQKENLKFVFKKFRSVENLFRNDGG